VKTIIKLAIMMAVLNAMFQYSRVAWGYYQLKDGAQQAVVFGAAATTQQLHDQIMRRAADLRVPLAPEGLRVQRIEDRTIAEASYVQPVAWVPGFERPVSFSFMVDGIAVSRAVP
jgi:hypothetical protein